VAARARRRRARRVEIGNHLAVVALAPVVLLALAAA
jgi:hypothetical protein